MAVRSAPVSTSYGVRVAEVADPDGTLIQLIEGDSVYARRWQAPRLTTDN